MTSLHILPGWGWPSGDLPQSGQAPMTAPAYYTILSHSETNKTETIYNEDYLVSALLLGAFYTNSKEK